MKTRPPDLTLFAARNGGTFPAALVGKIIDGRPPLPGHGGPDMPVWGDAFRRVNENLGMSATARTAILSSHVGHRAMRPELAISSTPRTNSSPIFCVLGPMNI